jgi:hypothetical protein
MLRFAQHDKKCGVGARPPISLKGMLHQPELLIQKD